jgi:hypothetical protein
MVNALAKGCERGREDRENGWLRGDVLPLPFPTLSPHLSSPVSLGAELPGASTGQQYSPALRRQAAAGPFESFVTNHFMRK